MSSDRVVLGDHRGHSSSFICMASRWAGLELVAGPSLFARAWPRLCAGYMADAIGRKPEPWQRQDVGAAVEALLQGQAEPAQAVGLGAEYRLDSVSLAGGILVAQGRVAHLMAFPVAGASDASEASEVNQ